VLRQGGDVTDEDAAVAWHSGGLLPEPVTDRVDSYGRLLRYVVRVRDGVNLNIRLVAVGAAAPYFYRHRRGKYANRLEALAKRARAKRLGLTAVQGAYEVKRMGSDSARKGALIATDRRVMFYAKKMGGFDLESSLTTICPRSR
jgi:Staphylococcal nuclease homologue